MSSATATSPDMSEEVVRYTNERYNILSGHLNFIAVVESGNKHKRVCDFRLSKAATLADFSARRTCKL
ncbi:hypothetical protein FF1_040154 [Malus domestica]